MEHAPSLHSLHNQSLVEQANSFRIIFFLLLLTNITAKYNSDEFIVLLSAFVLDKWYQSENPTSNLHYDEKHQASINLSVYLKPHLSELMRLN